MKVNFRKVVALTAVAALALTGCGGKGGGAETGADGRPKIIVDMWAGGEEDTAAIKKQIEIAQKALPDIEIELRTAPWGDFFTKLTSNMGTGNMACVTGMNSGKLSDFKEGFVELTEADLATAGLSAKDLAPGATDILSSSGTMYGVPFDMATMLVYYNADMIQATGAPEPRVGWTFEDFEATAKAATTGDKQGFAVGMGDFQWQALPIAKAGAQPVTAEGKLDIANPAFVEAATWYSGLVTEHHVALPVASASDAGWGEEQYSNGNAAMAVDGTWNAVSYLGNDAGFEVGMVNLPAGASGSSLGLVLGSGYGVAKTCQNKEAALKVMGALLSKEAQDHIASSGRSYPARTESQPLYFSSIDEKYRDRVKTAYEAAFAHVEGQRVSPNWSKVNAYIQPELVSVYTGAKPMAEMLQTAQQQFEQ
ncbi:MAG: sugar ABC transporter substrate-binding protein [Propionibacteriaceae bacterium]|nr:sugar ABC transporter substrate-binding protein [Propionibacteriaceae bacterium]